MQRDGFFYKSTAKTLPESQQNGIFFRHLRIFALFFEKD